MQIVDAKKCIKNSPKVEWVGVNGFVVRGVNSRKKNESKGENIVTL